MANVTTVQTIVALQATATPAGAVTQLSKAGREGNFMWKAGNFTAQAASDPLMGIYVPSTVTAITSGCWVREWDGITGRPEWFGAIADSSAGTVPADNYAAIQACIALCPITQLGLASYYVNDTVWVNKDYRTLQGTLFGIEGPLPQGTQLIQTNNTKDVVRVGGTSTSDRRRIVRVRDICARWATDPVAPASGTDTDRLACPKAFHFMHCLVFQAYCCVAVDALIGHAFFDNINSQSVQPGCTRTRSLGAHDFMIGMWPYGSAAETGFAGANASLYIRDANVTMSGELQTVLDKATGLYATKDFADLYVDGFETSQVNFGIRLDGAGWTYAGGHGDIHLRRLVFDQCKGNGIEIHNTNSYAKIHIDQFYIQIVSTGDKSNNGIQFLGGSGFATVANGQIVGGSGNQSIGIWLQNYPTVNVTDSVIIEAIGYPVNALNTNGLRISPLIGDGVNNSGGTRPAVSLTGVVESHVDPTIYGQSSSWARGIALEGSANARITVDPTRVNAGGISSGRKLMVNGTQITAPGYYKSNGTSGAASDNGVSVVGFPG